MGGEAQRQKDLPSVDLIIRYPQALGLGQEHRTQPRSQRWMAGSHQLLALSLSRKLEIKTGAKWDPAIPIWDAIRYKCAD